MVLRMQKFLRVFRYNFKLQMLPQTGYLLLSAFFVGCLAGFTCSQMMHETICSYNSRQFDSDVRPYYLNSITANQSKLTYALDETKVVGNYTVRTLANRLYNETRVLCWVLTGEKNHDKRAKHIKNTWGKRCNKLIFISSKDDEQLGAVRVTTKEGRSSLWRKTREGFKYVYDHFYNDYDWFLKADDDTYVILENLRVFLYPYSTEAPVYFGCKYRTYVEQGYMSGGAGYVLSKEALRRFAVEAYYNATLCRKRDGGAEDHEMGFCLQNVGVAAGDTRDAKHRGRFFPTDPQGHLMLKPQSHWWWKYSYYNTTDGLDCCSNYAISFHYITPGFLYVMDYLLYRLFIFGVDHRSNALPPKLNMTQEMIKWRSQIN